MRNYRNLRSLLFLINSFILSVSSFCFAEMPNKPASLSICNAGHTVAVVAHLDDDLLFIGPDIANNLAAGQCVTVVHLVGGSDSGNFAYVLERERGIKQAYARWAKVSNNWTESTQVINGKKVHRMILDNNPRLTLLEFRIHGGGVRGGDVPLADLWDDNATLTTWGMKSDGSETENYNRDSLRTTLGVIFSDSNVTSILTLNPDTVPFIEHPDHIYAARITRSEAQYFGKNLTIPIKYYTTYPVAAYPKNFALLDIQAKRDAVASYFAIDGGDSGAVFGEYRWDGDWVARNYPVVSTTDANLPNVQATTFSLMNEYSSQCLNSVANEVAPSLGGCTGGNNQNWHWQTTSAKAGQRQTAQLVDNNGLCIAEHNTVLSTQPCNANDTAQKWTPWDFGLIYTPENNCLISDGGALGVVSCENLTASSRWAMKNPSQWSDIRQQGALYGDVRGNKKMAIIYIHRQGEGPGFNIWVADQNNTATKWFENTITFDSTATAASCGAQSLCYDETRFLLGDFTGDGKADVMAIKPSLTGGTQFWLLKSTGTSFSAPVLWSEISNYWRADSTQQYLAGDFNSDGRDDILLTFQRGDSGLNFWVVLSNGNSAQEPQNWLEAPKLPRSTHVLLGKVYGSTKQGLLAVYPSGDSLSITQYASDGTSFQQEKTDVLHIIWYKNAKVITSDLDNDGLDDLVVLHARGDGSGTNLWVSKGGQHFGAPVLLSNLTTISWADMYPGILDVGEGSHSLIMFSRDNVILDDIHFTAGGIKISAVDITSTLNISSPYIWSDATGMFSETLWRERLE